MLKAYIFQLKINATFDVSINGGPLHIRIDLIWCVVSISAEAINTSPRFEGYWSFEINFLN